jgi:histidinol-phosphatase (PHP family)
MIVDYHMHLRGPADGRRDLLARCRERGVAATLASDAHVAQDVGRDFEAAVEHLHTAGYETVTVFDGRVGRQEPLG